MRKKNPPAALRQRVVSKSPFAKRIVLETFSFTAYEITQRASTDEPYRAKLDESSGARFHLRN